MYLRFNEFQETFIKVIFHSKSMANTLKITGGKTDLVYTSNRSLVLELDLFAHYRDIQYNLSDIMGGLRKEDLKPVIVLHFSREDGKDVPNGLNKILLLTNCEGLYVATGASRCDVVSTEQIDVKGYKLDDDLKIYVDPSADKAIRYIPRLIKAKYSGNIPGNTSDDIITAG